MLNLGETIATRRKELGWSQEELSYRSGISLRTIQRIEKNTSSPRPYTLKVLADLLGIPVNQLHPPAGKAPQHATVLHLINLSTLAGIIIPFANILAPWLLRSQHRNQQGIAAIGGQIIFAQIIWTAASLLVLVAGHLLHYWATGALVTGRVPVVFVLYTLLLCLQFPLFYFFYRKINRQQVAMTPQ